MSSLAPAAARPMPPATPVTPPPPHTGSGDRVLLFSLIGVVVLAVVVVAVFVLAT
jgi:hypothetical protein